MRPLWFVVFVACGRAPDPSADAATDAATDAPQKTPIRVMAANLSSGTMQSYDTPGIHIFQGLRPDIVLIQELNYPSGARSLVDTAFGTQFAMYVEPTGSIPNGIVSRYPIIDSGTWVDASVSDRAYVWARIDVPGPIDVFAVSLHLLTTGATQRDTEAKQVVGYVEANAPAGAYVVIGGDFNTDTTAEAALTDLSSVVVVAAPYPADQTGNTNTSINRNHPHDWVLVGPSLQSRAIPVVIGTSTYAAGLVFDSRVYTPLADVAPILAGDSAAPGMQHMPVVRDFLLDQ
jgi:endonuclease/exonuclease/phosphatase family metal-dependent hydrolase